MAAQPQPLLPMPAMDVVVLRAPLTVPERPVAPPEEDPRAYVERIFRSVDERTIRLEWRDPQRGFRYRELTPA